MGPLGATRLSLLRTWRTQAHQSRFPSVHSRRTSYTWIGRGSDTGIASLSNERSLDATHPSEYRERVYRQHDGMLKRCLALELSGNFVSSPYCMFEYRAVKVLHGKMCCQCPREPSTVCCIRQRGRYFHLTSALLCLLGAVGSLVIPLARL